LFSILTPVQKNPDFFNLYMKITQDLGMSNSNSLSNISQVLDKQIGNQLVGIFDGMFLRQSELGKKKWCHLWEPIGSHTVPQGLPTLRLLPLRESFLSLVVISGSLVVSRRKVHPGG
jgi:hypothetical protein